MDFHLSMDGVQINRQTYGVLDLFGDLGGLLELIKIVFGLLALPASTMRLSAILSNRLYHQSETTRGTYSTIKNDKYVLNVSHS